MACLTPRNVWRPVGAVTALLLLLVGCGGGQNSEPADTAVVRFRISGDADVLPQQAADDDDVRVVQLSVDQGQQRQDTICITEPPLDAGDSITRTFTLLTNVEYRFEGIALDGNGNVVSGPVERRVTLSPGKGALKLLIELEPSSSTEGPVLDCFADMAVTMDATPESVNVGQSLTYTLTVTNDGPKRATNIRLTDDLPAGVTSVEVTPSQGSCPQAGAPFTCDLGDLASGDSAEVTIRVTPTMPGIITNTARVEADEPDSNRDNDEESISITVGGETPSPPLTLGVSQNTPNPVFLGTPFTYTIVVTNNEPRRAANVRLTDDLPADVTSVEVTPSQGSCPQAGAFFPDPFTCDLGDLAPGAFATVTVSVIPTKTGTITNTVIAEATGFTSNTDSISTTVVDPPPPPPPPPPLPAVFAVGTGLNNATTDTMTLHIPNNPPLRAFLNWQRFDAEDPTITITIDNGKDLVEEQVSGELAADSNSRCFLADITDILKPLIVPGTATYRVSVVNNINNIGAGIVVITGVLNPSALLMPPPDEMLDTVIALQIHSEPALTRRAEVQAGCDFFFYNNPKDSNSEVITFDIGPASSVERLARVSLFVGGAQSAPSSMGMLRGSDILFFTGTGTPPLTLIDAMEKPINGAISLGRDATGLVANDGDSWDTFGRNSGMVPPDPGLLPTSDPDLRGNLMIPAGATFVSFQLLSPSTRDGVSAIVSLAVLEIVGPASAGGG